MARRAVAFRKLSCLILVFLFTFTAGSPVASPSQTQTPAGQGLIWQTAGDAPGTIACETDRLSDYYGFGVRLGLYLSCFTGWVANNFVPGEIGIKFFKVL